MEQEQLNQYGEFLSKFTKKNGKALGERTIHGILTLAKFLEETKQNQSLETLNLKKMTR